MKRFKDFLAEGFSNYKGTLLQDVMAEVKPQLDKIFPIGNYTFKKIYDDGNEKISINVKIKFGKRYVTQCTNNEDKTIENMRTLKWIITINTNLWEEGTKEKALATLAHEITHMSQWLNKSLKYDWNLDKKNMENLKSQNLINKRLKLSSFYWKNHSSRLTEKEASLIEFFEILKNKSYSILDSIYLRNRKPYLDGFDNKTVLRKAAAFGLTNTDIKEFISYAKSKYNPIIEKSIIDFNQRKEYLYFNVFLLIVYKMFNFGKKLIEKLKRSVESDIDNQKINDSKYNPQQILLQIDEYLDNITRD